jgi:hypothetical protein
MDRYRPAQLQSKLTPSPLPSPPSKGGEEFAEGDKSPQRVALEELS